MILNLIESQFILSVLVPVLVPVPVLVLGVQNRSQAQLGSALLSFDNDTTRIVYL